MNEEEDKVSVLKPTTMTTTEAVAVAGRLLLKSDENRREPNGSFDPAFRGRNPDSDWGVAAQIAQAALRNLDEGMPNGQRERCATALGALLIGVALLERALAAKGVVPHG